MKLNVIVTAALALFMIGCASNSGGSKEVSTTEQRVERAPQKIINSDSKEAFNILIKVPYAESGMIPDKVRDECTQLGAQFSTSIAKYAPKHDILINRIDGPLPASGRTVELEIVSVYSEGNAFIGHRKSVVVNAKLMLDGKEVDSTKKTRFSGGGFLGGFKGSCSVLAHTVNTLGSDIGKWLSTK